MEKFPPFSLLLFYRLLHCMIFLLKKYLLSVYGKNRMFTFVLTEWIISNLVRTKFYMTKVSYV